MLSRQKKIYLAITVIVLAVILILVGLIKLFFLDRRQNIDEENLSSQPLLSGSRYAPSNFLRRAQQQEEEEEKKFKQIVQKTSMDDLKSSAKIKGNIADADEELEIPAFIRRKMGI